MTQVGAIPDGPLYCPRCGVILAIIAGGIIIVRSIEDAIQAAEGLALPALL